MVQSNSLQTLVQDIDNITIYGTVDEPLIKCTDIIVKLLGYRDSLNANWFKKMKNDDSFVRTLRFTGSPDQMYFTEVGVYKALMKSNKPIAEEFQIRVCQLLKKMRQDAIQNHQSQIQQLEQQIEEMKDETRICSIYRIIDKRTGELLYIGKDKSQIQNRFQQHLTERRKIVSNHQLIDIKLASLEEQDIQVLISHHPQNEIDQEERNAIQQEMPPYNQIQANHLYKCQRCQKPYKSRLPFQKHESRCSFNSN